MKFLLVSTNTALTRRWLSEESPNLNTWVEITLDIYSIENISAFVILELEQFASQWEKWAEYVTSHTPDSVATNH